MDKKGINIIKEALKGYCGASVFISTSHKLYGKQNIKCKLDYIFDEEKIGFRVSNGQEIYVHMDEIVDYGVEEGIYVADDLMEIKIKIA